MFTSIVFSKDRPLQLDLTLKSIATNFSNSRVVVLYKTSNEEYESSYSVLMQEHENVSFVKQRHSIFDDIHKIIEGLEGYVYFLTDDCIVYQPATLSVEELDNLFETVRDLEQNKLLSCVSLRLGENTTKRMAGGELIADAIPSEVYLSGNKFLLWNFTSIAFGGYWCYPLSVDGHIFKVSEMKKFTSELCLLDNHYSNCGKVPRAKHAWRQTPNEFESKLQRFMFELKPVMASLRHSCVVNSPNNRVQDSHDNKSGDVHAYAPLDLKDEFDSGRRINLKDLNFQNIECPHQELDILQGI
tara:strand:+ start:239 stop:1138 length:900 start_codon:yes stop_codon:yes gene_type:complete